MQRDARVRDEPLGHGFCFVRRQIVGDQMNLAARGLGRDHAVQEAQELRTGVPGRRHPFHFAGGDVKRGVQGEGAVPLVLEAVPLGASGRERQHGIQSAERLNRGFLIDREHHRICRRREIQADDVGGFVSKFGSSLVK